MPAYSRSEKKIKSNKYSTAERGQLIIRGDRKWGSEDAQRISLDPE